MIPIPNLWTDKNEQNGAHDPPLQRRRRQENVLHGQGGPHQEVRKDSLLEVWEMSLPDSELQKIADFSKIKAVELDIPTEDLTLSSLKAIIGFIYFRGVQ